MEILEVSSKSSPNSVTEAIAGIIHEDGVVGVQATGAGASNQAVKAIVIARGYLTPPGIDIVCIPAFTSISIDGGERATIKLVVESR